MDFDIGNILYVVITLVAIIVSLLGKKKKPAGKKANPGFFENLEQVLKMGQEDPPLTDLRDHEPDLVEEDVDLDYQYAEEDYTTPARAPSLMEEFESAQQDRDRSILDSGKSEVERSIESTEEIEFEEEEQEFLKILNDFDGGSAIVYSTIINRPDY